MSTILAQIRNNVFTQASWFTVSSILIYILLFLNNCSIDHTYKVYIGGAQKRPDGNYSCPILNPAGEVIAQVADGNRKDIRDAVEAAHKAAPGYQYGWIDGQMDECMDE